ncbi:MAG: radical SAM protein [Nanoarchaeota archaeon]|nr:radical SAM protein [Nanoarchaeota archaeon]
MKKVKDTLKKMGEKSNSGIKKAGLELAKEKMTKEGYGMVGDHSAVKVCLWTKHSIRGDRGCWKEKFYGISSAGCCQMTPSLFHCENKCLHCWRDLTYTFNKSIENPDDPKKILDGIVAVRKDLLMGFKGREGIDMKKFEEALEPKLYTLSLSGEPTLYPRLGEMFAEIRKRGAVSFLVTNGLNPEVIRNLSTLPTQITVSTNAPNEKLFLKWHRSTKKEAWNVFNETLDVIRGLGRAPSGIPSEEGKVRRVIRLTLVDKGKEGKFKDMTNMTEENVGEYCDLIRKAEPDFVHVKGYKSVGYARPRMGYDNQPWFEAVKEYALKIEKKLEDYEVAAEDERCCVVMLKRKGGIDLKIDKV